MAPPKAVKKTCSEGHEYTSGVGCKPCARRRQNERRRAISAANAKPKPTEKTCKRGHTYSATEPLCRECQRFYYWNRRRTDSEWAEKWRKHNREYASATPERRAAAARRSADKYRSDPEYRERAKARHRANVRKRAQEDPEYLRAKSEAEKVRLAAVNADPERRKKYLATLRQQNHRRRARLRDACSPGVTPEQWAAICAANASPDGETLCVYCKKAGAITIDHVIPICRGGRDEPANVVPACKRCNSSKNGRLLSEWRPKYALPSPPTANDELLQSDRHLLGGAARGR
jgi:5-methylcytosine-specific restriction endonuclease McrA